jgi:MFS family permease
VIHSQPLAAMAPPDASMRAGLILAALVLWSAAAAAFWAFTGTASSTLGVPAQTVSQALAIAMVAGLAGMLVPMVIGSRFGRVMPLLLASIGLSLSCALFFAGSGLVKLAVALTLQQFCWNISSVYLLAGLAMLDTSGRYSALGAVAQIGGMAVGPAVSGLFLARFGYGGLPAAVTAVSLIASAIFFVSLRGSGQGKPAEAPGHA